MAAENVGYRHEMESEKKEIIFQWGKKKEFGGIFGSVSVLPLPMPADRLLTENRRCCLLLIFAHAYGGTKSVKTYNRLCVTVKSLQRRINEYFIE
jgi:hypothetical protein